MKRNGVGSWLILFAVFFGLIFWASGESWEFTVGAAGAMIGAASGAWLAVFRLLGPNRRALNSRGKSGDRYQGISPSLSQLLLRLAVRRLPAEMAPHARERWEREMRADIASLPWGWRCLWHALGIWRKGAPAMPVGEEPTFRPAADLAPGDEQR